MKNKSLLFFLLLTTLVPWAAMGQETVTVCDGTAAGTTTSINGTIPIDGVYVDRQGTTSEFIIPATTEHMDELVGGVINKLTFYLYESYNDWGSPTVQFYMGEVEETTLSNVHNPNDFTIVATVEGLSNQSAEMEVTLTYPYTYGGGNLLIGTYVQTASSDWVWTGFNGIEAPANSSRRRYLTYGTGEGAAFLPKTTFTFEPANDCPRPTSLVASNVTAHTATMTWTIVDESYNAQFNLEYKKTTDDTWTRYGLGNTRSFTLTGLDDNSEYQVRIQTVCGNDDEDNSIWKYASNFTTLIACPTPTDLTVTDGSITAYDAAVTWNGTSNSYVVMIGQENALVDADFENQQIPSSFTNDATYPWTVVANTHSGAYCAQSATGAHSATSALEITVDVPHNMTLMFSAKVSSEADYDFAYFSIDNTNQADLDGISGNGEWIDYSYPLTAGSHTLRWYYTKDNGVSHYDDCFYVDDIVIASTASWTQYTTSAQTYTFGNLTPHTPYQVKVKGNCGSEGYSVETTPVRFTTLPTCFPPANVHFAEGPTTHSVTVAWDFEEGELVQIGMFHGYFTDPSEIQTYSLDAPEGSSSATWSSLYSDYDYTFAIRKYCSETDQSEVVVLPFHTLETCTTPTNLTVVENSISGHSATITWDVNGENDYWNIEFATDEDFVNVLYEDYTGNPPFTFTQIQPETTYYVRMKANCVPSGNGESHYSNVISFTTLAPCPAPYNLAVDNLTYESATLNWVGFGESYDLSYRTAGYLDVVGIEEPFATSNHTPTGWSRYSGELNSDGTASLSTTNYWGFVTRNFSSIHAYVNLFSQQKLWLVTPSFTVGSNYSLNFDAAYTAYNSTNPPDLTGTDDRFLVLISTDNKEHWTILREWNNAGTGDAVLNDLPVTFQPVDEIDLSAYADQTAYIAFYVASTVYNASNDLHIDNVAIGHHIAAGEWHTATTATTTYDLSGLVYDTPYEVHVQSDCGSYYGTSNPSEAFTFTTLPPPPCDIVDNFALVEGSETHQGATFTWDDNGDDFTVMVGPMTFTNHFACFFDGETIPDDFTHTGDYGFDKDVDGGRNCAKSVTSGISNTTADLVLQINVPLESSLGFNARVTSEENYDKAYFSIDGVVQENLNGISGEGGWYHYDYTLSAGMHTLRWYYTKDNSENMYDDCFRVSEITISSYIVDDWTSFEHATSPFTVTGLNTSTEYYAKAIRNCTTGIHSNDSYVASFTTLPCLPPTGLEVLDLTSEYVAFHFDVEEGVTYQYCIVQAGNGPSEILFNGNTNVAPTYIGYGLLGFHPDTDYVIYVRKKCSEDEVSEPTSVTFHTLHECASIPTVSLPRTEGFEGMGAGYPAHILPECWDFINESNDDYVSLFPSVYNTQDDPDHGSSLLGFTSGSSDYYTNPQPQYAILPPMEDVNQLIVSFYAKGGTVYASTFRVGVMEGMDATTFTTIQTFTIAPSSTPEYELYTVSFENYEGNGNRIAIMLEAATELYCPLMVDDITVSQHFVVVDADHDFTDNFEYWMKWELENGDLTNAWTWGEAAHNGNGSRGLYISNNGGTTNAYSFGNETMVYAYKSFMLQPGIYEFSYDWLAYGENKYDYLRVALVPETVTLEAGTDLPDGLTYSDMPQGWIALDGGMQRNLVTEWQTESHEVEVTEAGIYKMVFAWRNDDSEGSNPPAAIDNVSVKLMTCPTPANLAVSNPTTFTADINWTTHPNVDSYTMKYRTARHLDTIFTEGFEGDIDDWTLRDCVIGNTGVVTSGHSGSHSFRFHYNSNPPQHLISPELTGVTEGMLLEFYYKNQSTSYPETFQMGFSSTDNATESFTFGDEITAGDTQWHLYSQPIPAGTKYICWKYTSNDQYYLYIDDIEVGMEITAGDWVYVNNIESGGFTLNNLAPESTYEVQVKSDCSDKWSATVTFTTTEIQTMEQTLTLAAGWNWWAPMAQINADQLRTVLGDNLPHLKSKDGEVYTYAYLIPGQMYKLQTNTIVENVTLEGVIVPINISIEEGANWIGYTGTTASIATALGNFVPTDGDKIISQDGGFAIFDGNSYTWQGTLTQLTYGQGYVYISRDSVSKTLYY